MMSDRKHMVVLTGAGVSAESGIKTFRDSDGLWETHRIEDVATPEGWAANPQLVLDFYNQRRAQVKNVFPNAAHTGLAELEKYYDVTIVTQNIDDLHERGGSSRVIHLHGEILKMRSTRNQNLVYPIAGDIKLGDLAEDGSQLRPHIVWFGEAVPMIERAARVMEDADIFVCIGTSLQVYPAAGLIDFVPPFASKYIIDKHIPPVSGHHNLITIEKPATEGVAELMKQLIPD